MYTKPLFRSSRGGGSTPVGSVSVSPAAGSVAAGNTLQLSATVSHEAATNKKEVIKK
jgi:uncharacterized protein YjdB